MTIEQFRQKLKKVSVNYDVELTDEGYAIYYGTHYCSELYLSEGEWHAAFYLPDEIGAREISILKHILPAMEKFMCENNERMEK